MLDSVFLQPCHDVGICLVLEWKQLLDLLCDFNELFPGGHIGLVFGVLAVEKHFVVQAADSYHEEFVKVGTEYLHEAEPFKQRSILVECLLQNSCVEFEP